MIRRRKSKHPAKVWYRDTWGARQKKYDELLSATLGDKEWRKIDPKDPYLFFVPRDNKNIEEYEAGFGITELFSEYSSGIQTKRDKLTIDFDSITIEHRIQRIAELDPEDIRTEFDLPNDGRDWKVALAKQDVEENPGEVTPILYRPFDIRYTYYTGKTKGFLGYPRRQIMQHMAGKDNVGLIVNRQVANDEFSHALVTKWVNCHGTLYLGNRGQDYICPLYVFPEAEEGQLDFGEPVRQPNFHDDVVANISEHIGVKFDADGPDKYSKKSKSFTPLVLFDYIYAVLYSPEYRSQFREFLRIDFPRIPLPKSSTEFFERAKIGSKLRSFHLFEEQLDTTGLAVDGGTNLTIEAVRYEREGSRVYVNEDVFIEGVSSDVFGLSVGGYEPAEKWLKDRKGRQLTHNDIRHYMQIVRILEETMRLVEKLD